MTQSASEFLLCFQSLLSQGTIFVFPCGPRGEVVMDQLTDQVRNNYLFARAMVGRELRAPEIRTAS